MKQGEIWLVKYDHGIGHEFKKTRPAIIISSNATLRTSNLITIMAITSNCKGVFCGDILLEKDENNRLYCDSIIKVYHISTFDKCRFVNKIGLASDGILEKIKEYIKQHFGLNL